MKRAFFFIAILAFTLQTFAQEEQKSPYIEYEYSKCGESKLKAYVFSPEIKDTKESCSAIVIFHGGGWTIGEPAWAFDLAQHYKELGIVAVAAQYRLSNQKDVTPLEAMSDAREVIKWMRINKDVLHIDPDKIVAYGWSAGAHLAASAAIFNNSLSAPNALILVSPAVSLQKDDWFNKILLNRAEIDSVSPDKNVREGMPPTIILQGRDDTVTPLAGVQNFADRMKAAGNYCELIIYDGVGHLFTPSSEPDDQWPNPDPKIKADASAKADEFLKLFGYIE
jgi:acetyl esterase/lipase